MIIFWIFVTAGSWSMENRSKVFMGMKACKHGLRTLTWSCWFCYEWSWRIVWCETETCWFKDKFSTFIDVDQQHVTVSIQCSIIVLTIPTCQLRRVSLWSLGIHLKKYLKLIQV